VRFLREVGIEFLITVEKNSVVLCQPRRNLVVIGQKYR
jgi:hypothetical protein